MPRAATHTELLLAVEQTPGVPLHVRLEQALRRAIQTGRLASGALVPSTRALALELGVSRGLVVNAYEQLIAEGYLTASRGSATFVTRRSAAEAPAAGETERSFSPRYDFRPGRPDLGLFPRRAWLSALRRALAELPELGLDYPDPRGAAPARGTLASYLNRSRATRARTDRMILCTGFAQGMRLVGAVLRARGVRRIAVEDPGHAFESADVGSSGLTLVPVPVDDSGLRVERLERLRVGAVLVTPAHQYPTGAVLSPSRRAALLAWAERHDTLVVEDDYDGEYRYDRDPVGALQGLAPERVVYIGSVSKMLAPGIRCGWILAPGALASALAQEKLAADRGSPVLDQLALAEFIRRGDLDRHLRRTRLVYKRRRAALAQALQHHFPGLPIRGIAAGLHLTLELPRGVDEAALIERAARASIAVYSERLYHARPGEAPSALLLGYCRLSGREMIDGVRTLASIVMPASSSP